IEALAQPARSIREFSPLEVARPWDASLRHQAPLDSPETFEMHPVGDSLALRAQLQIDPAWRMRTLVRGVLRPNGWGEAWAGVLDRVAGGQESPADIAHRLFADHPYAPGEADRVVMCVSLEVRDGGAPVWHRTWALDAWGDARGRADARLGSHCVALAVRAASAGAMPVGVSAGPAGPQMAVDWLAALDTQAQRLRTVDHLA
ncbi:MAG: saccharopine dehydrogenase, partial [Pseudomonadota bacterium]